MYNLDLFKLNLQSLSLPSAEKYIPEIDPICTVPGITTFSAISVIGEIGVDMSVFPTSKHLCSRAGLTPQNDHSAGRKKHSLQHSEKEKALQSRALCSLIRHSTGTQSCFRGGGYLYSATARLYCAPCAT